MNFYNLKKSKFLLCIVISFLLTTIYIITVHTFISNTAKQVPPEHGDYLIILGARLHGERMSLALYNRMEASLIYLKRNPSTKVIVSGGQGPGEDITEAKAMSTYLVKKGISEDRIFLEDQSTSTYENLLFSKKWIKTDDLVIIVSNDFHLFRAKIIANRLDYNTKYTLAAQTPKIVESKLWLREYLAIIKTLIFDK